MKLTDFGNPTTTAGAVTNIAFMATTTGLLATNLVFGIKTYNNSTTAVKKAEDVVKKVDATQGRIDEAVAIFAPKCGIMLQPQAPQAPQAPAPQQQQVAPPPQQPQAYYYQAPTPQAPQQPQAPQYYQAPQVPYVPAQGQPGQNL